MLFSLIAVAFTDGNVRTPEPARALRADVSGGGVFLCAGITFEAPGGALPYAADSGLYCAIRTISSSLSTNLV